MDKHQVAHIFEEIATLLELNGENPFRIRAYLNAARTLENLSESEFEKACEEKILATLPGIGKDLSQKIIELVNKGKLPFYEKLKSSLPPTLFELLNVPGLGGKKIKLLYETLQIETLDQLIEACEKKKLSEIKGFGPKSEEKILKNIKRIAQFGKRLLWWQANEIASRLLLHLKENEAVHLAEIAGSLRRKLETIGDIDIVVASSKPKAVTEWFLKHPLIKEVESSGPTRLTVRLVNGLHCDMRIVETQAFAFALLYFTGSKDHNIKLRQLALAQELHLSEYGFEPKKGKIDSEEKIYNALNLPYIPPEMRENVGEIEAAQKGELPKLVEMEDIKGVFHCHTADSDGHNTLEEMVAEAQKHRLQYIGISDHSKSSFQANGLSEERLIKQVERIDNLNAQKKYKTHVFAGVECDILPNGELDFADEILKELDFVIVSVHSAFKQDSATMTKRIIKALENPHSTILGHMTGRLLLRRDGYEVNVSKVIDAAIANGKIIELNAHPNRLDMDWRHWISAREKGLKCSINPDAHRLYDLNYYKAGVNIARKGWLTKQHIFNTQPLAKVKKALWKTR